MSCAVAIKAVRRSVPLHPVPSSTAGCPASDRRNAPRRGRAGGSAIGTMAIDADADGDGYAHHSVEGGLDCSDQDPAMYGVTLESPNGNITDVTMDFANGTQESPAVITLSDGTYRFCPSKTWYATMEVSGATVTLASYDGRSNIPVLSGGGTKRLIKAMSGTDLTLESLTLQEGYRPTGSNNYGGAVVMKNASTLTIDTCTFDGNTANYGGAIGLRGGSSASITNSSFSGNTSLQGGAIYAVAFHRHRE